ncbi:hypothetical protein E5288_WYG019918 [Bos mutus]|uniref:Uncharacterized protein n=1 Tax=Bos mutus TaxID=72004 RepID=A0A6B0RWP6_9CETA|nr:hypothetical protein [Bos mutus]
MKTETKHRVSPADAVPSPVRSGPATPGRCIEFLPLTLCRVQSAEDQPHQGDAPSHANLGPLVDKDRVIVLGHSE